MEMTTDESERYLRLMLGGMKYSVRYWKDRDKEESDIEQTNVEAVEVAIDTMHKYQMMQAYYNAVLEEIKEKAELDEDYCNEIGEITIASAFREIIDICHKHIREKE